MSARSEPSQPPARLVLLQAEATNRAFGHESLGFLSESHGFMPIQPPLTELPEPYRIWDDVATRLPALIREGAVRDALNQMPVLSADALDEPSLLRASTIMSIFAHSYMRSRSPGPTEIPDSVARPWEEITRRLDRPHPVLSYIDLIVYNWRRLDPAGPLEVENLELLVGTIDNPEERIFYLTQVEILARCTPIVGAVVRAQEATVRGDADALASELIAIADVCRTVTENALPKIDPSARAATHVDPIVWAKTVAPFAVPLEPGVQGPSGTSSPIFHLLDAFFDRRRYRSTLGEEMVRLRDWYPRHWREFVAAVGEVSVPERVARFGGRALRGLLADALEAYAGESGFLGRHRLKVYGYLELAFKIGRSITIGGFSGLFQDRAWDEVNDELEAARAERHDEMDTAPSRLGRIVGHTRLDPNGRTTGVRVSVAGEGIRCRPGDRIAVLPENSETIIGETLRSLRASGEELVRLDAAWRSALAASGGAAEQAPLRTLVRHGAVRPVMRRAARMLLAITGDPILERIVASRSEDQWELWDLLDLLQHRDFDPRLLWRAHPADPESICRLIPPDVPRLYSIGAVTRDGAGIVDTFELTVGLLHYETTHAGATRPRLGTASAFLTGGASDIVRLRLVPAHRFRLPDDHRRPIVMFAGGTGVSPFLGFIQGRVVEPEAGEAWLFLGARTFAEVPQNEALERAVALGRLDVRFAFSREDVEVRVERASEAIRFAPRPGARRRIDEAILDDENAKTLRRLLSDRARGGSEAIVYVCGRSGFATSVRTALGRVLADLGNDLAGLAAAGRYVEEIFTSYTAPVEKATRVIDASDVAMHNDDEQGSWMVLDGRVYDITPLLQLHPGGSTILTGYAGLDATAAFAAVGHSRDPSVSAVRSLYEIGVVRRLDFGSAWAVAIGRNGLRSVRIDDLYRAWARLLYLVVEMENAFRNDRAGMTGPLGVPDPASTLDGILMLDAHRRFLASYLEGLFEPLGEVWAMTCGACSQTEDHRWIGARLRAIWTSAAGLAVASG
ncbi:MAG: cytochrome b5 domain-containing protein, partial [Actinomycetota bacterium]